MTTLTIRIPDDTAARLRASTITTRVQAAITQLRKLLSERDVTRRP